MKFSSIPSLSINLKLPEAFGMKLWRGAKATDILLTTQAEQLAPILKFLLLRLMIIQ